VADVTTSDIASALNTAWDDKTYAKVMPGSGFTSGGKYLFNDVRRVSSVQMGTYGSTRQVFQLVLRHPTEAAINYTNDLIMAMTVANTIVMRPMQVGRAPNGEYEAIIEFETIQ
jgi:hypothetical protein